MASQKVVNNPLGSYPVAVDRAADATQRQAVGLDFGTVSGDVWTPSRVSTANPLPVTASISGSSTVNQGTPLASGAGWRTTEYGTTGVPNFYFNFGGLFDIPTTVLIDPVTLVIPSFSNASIQCTGDEAHDAADDGNPLKIGIKAADYEPTTSDVRSAGKTAVAANDRSNSAGNLFGEMVEGVNSYFFTLDNVSTTYNNTTTTASSTAKECWNYRQCTFSYELTRANSPTDILFEIEVSLNNGSTYTVLQNDFLGDLRESTASISASGIKKSVTFPIACHSIRVKATATGTTVSATFTAANCCIFLRN